VDHKATGDTTPHLRLPGPDRRAPVRDDGVTTAGPGGTSADSYTYDAVGNLATRTDAGDTDTFAWDAEEQLTSVSGPGGATDFVYDAEGTRLIKHDPAGATLYLASTEVRWNRATDTVSPLATTSSTAPPSP
jgi:YD repeat-containing protein